MGVEYMSASIAPVLYIQECSYEPHRNKALDRKEGRMTCARLQS